MKINFKYVGVPESSYCPFHETEDASGCDLRNATGKKILIHPHTKEKIYLGICVEIPKGYEGQLRPRSGISTKKCIMMLPSIGTIDADFRGEISATYFNPTNEIVVIDLDERIAQLVIAPYVKCEYNLKTELSNTSRGVGGFGSTGK